MMDITKKNLTELKAIAFDLIVEQDRVNKNLQIVQAEMNKRFEAEKVLPANEVQEVSKNGTN
jgi:hypothetical protein